ncbi:MAG: DUF421 domain-containing protein [Erysipelotrichaceae bacterium]|nr:DUF421 domain-containing protein [Erysipelotrichaceae bacterium]
MNNEFLSVIGRTILVLVILFVLTKWMGKKQVSQMNMYDYLIGITIGSIAADISLDIEKNVIAGVISLAIYSLSGVLVTYLTLKNMNLRRFLCGVPTILIENGNIIEKNLYKEGIDLNDLQEEARQNGYFDLSKINYAILETSGKVSFLASAREEPVTRGDMKVKVKDESLSANLIIDGTLLEKNLEQMKKDKSWLEKELNNRGYKDYKNILLMTLDNNGKITIYDKNVSSNTKILE